MKWQTYLLKISSWGQELNDAYEQLHLSVESGGIYVPRANLNAVDNSKRSTNRELATLFEIRNAHLQNQEVPDLDDARSRVKTTEAMLSIIR